MINPKPDDGQTDRWWTDGQMMDRLTDGRQHVESITLDHITSQSPNYYPLLLGPKAPFTHSVITGT